MNTQREFLNAVIEANISDEVTQYAQGAINKLDERNSKRKSTLTKKQVENEEIKEQIVAVLTDEYTTASEVGATVGISTSKASSLLRQLVEKEIAVVADIKIKGKGTVKGYKQA